MNIFEAIENYISIGRLFEIYGKNDTPLITGGAKVSIIFAVHRTEKYYIEYKDRAASSLRLNRLFSFTGTEDSEFLTSSKYKAMSTSRKSDWRFFSVGKGVLWYEDFSKMFETHGYKNIKSANPLYSGIGKRVVTIYHDLYGPLMSLRTASDLTASQTWNKPYNYYKRLLNSNIKDLDKEIVIKGIIKDLQENKSRYLRIEFGIPGKDPGTEYNNNQMKEINESYLNDIIEKNLINAKRISSVWVIGS